MKIKNNIAIIVRHPDDEVEFPAKYFNEFLKYIDIGEKEFFDTANSFRSLHLWKKEESKYILRHQVK